MKLRPNSKPIKCVETGAVFESAAAAARAYGFSVASLYEYFSDEKIHSCWGFHWERISQEEYFKEIGEGGV